MLMTERPEQEATVATPNLEDMILIAHVPFILYCDWWKLALQSFSHSCAPRHPASSTEDHGQLEIPEPLEADGEHFFA
jgi:hypothetical protein